MRQHRLRAGEDFGRNVDATGEYQLQGGEHYFSFGGFWNEAERAKVEGFDDTAPVLLSRQDDDRGRRIPLTQFGKRGESVPVRQVQIKQNEADVGVLRDELHRLAAIRALQDDRIGPQSLEHAAQRVANQDVIDRPPGSS
jgi:hypothetical protein